MTWRDVERFAKRANSLFAPVARWTGLAGLITSLIAHDYAMGYAFLGLLVAPSVVGKP